VIAVTVILKTGWYNFTNGRRGSVKIEKHAGAIRMMTMKKNMLAMTVVLVWSGLFQNAMGLSLKTWTSAGDASWNNSGNWTPSGIPGSSDSIVFNASGVANCNLIGKDTVGSLVIASGYAGVFSLSTDTLAVAHDLIISNSTLNASTGALFVLGNVNILGGTLIAPSAEMHVGGGWNHSAGSFVHSSGMVVFNGSTGGLIHTSAPFSSIYISGTGATWTVSGSPLTCNATLYLDQGTLSLGSGTVTSVGSIIAGLGTLDFGSSTFQVGSSTVNFGSLGNCIPGTGKLELVGAATIDFTPKPGMLFPEIVQNFTGTTNLMGPMLAKGITVINGTFKLNASHTGSTVGFIQGSGGSIDFNGDSINVSDSVNLSNVTSQMSGNGIMKFVNSSPANYVPPHFWPNPALIKAGSGQTTVRMNNIKGSKLTIESGTFALGSSGVNDSLDTVETVGGGLDFGNCTLSVRYSNVDLTPLISLTPGTGALKFTSTSLQSFWPSMSYTNPIIKHAETGTLKLMNTLIANGFEQPYGAGTFNLNGYDISIVNSGNFIVNSCTGPNMISGLANRTISVAGNVYITGNGPTVDINSGGSPWYLNAGGQILFNFVNFDHCNATGSPGVATNSLNNGGNVNWTFVKQWVGTGNWSTGTNWVPAGLPDVGDSVVFSGSTNCNADIQSQTVKAITFSGFTGSFYFNYDTMSILTYADFSGATGIVDSGYGALKFIGSGSSTLKAPGWPNCLPAIFRDGTGTVTVLNAIKTKGIIVKGGLFQFATSGVNDTVVQGLSVDGGTIHLGTNNMVHIGTFYSTGGTLNFGTGSTLDLLGTGSPDFGQLASIVPGTGTLKFSSTSPGPLYFGLNNPQIFPRIWSTGGMDTIIVTNSLKSSYVKIDNGFWRWDMGSGGNTPLIDSVLMTGGQMDFSKSTVQVKTGNANFLTAAKIVRGQGRLRFIGTSGMQQHLYPPPMTDTLPVIDVFNGSDVYVETNNLNADSLNLQYGTLFLNGKKAFCKSLISQGGGLNIGSDTLTIKGSADFSGLSPFLPGTGAVIIQSSGSHSVLFKPGSVAFNNLVLYDKAENGNARDTILMGGGTLQVNNDLVFRQLKSSFTPTYAVWRFDSLATDVVANGNVSGDEINAGSYSPFSYLNMGSGTWTLKKNTSLPIGNGTGKASTLVFSGAAGTAQSCSTSIANPADSLGVIQHTSNDTLRLKRLLRCRSFDQTAGTLDLNGDSLSVAGNFSAINSTSGTFAPLGGSVITIGGNANISGSSTSMANMVGGSMYNIYIASGKSLTVDWAKIADCSVNGGAGTGYATNSRKMNVNTFGWNISGMTLTWTGTANNSYKNPANWLPSIVPVDSDNVMFDLNGAGRTCMLDTSTGIRDITFNNEYTGAFNFSTNTLTVHGNADFGNVNSIANTSGTLRFYAFGTSYQYFTPKAGVTFPRIYMDGPGGNGNSVEVLSNPLTASSFEMNYGTWRWGTSGLTHTVGSMLNFSPSAVIDFGNSTVKVQDSVHLGCTAQYSSGATLEFVKGTGSQHVFSQSTLPGLKHDAKGTLMLVQNNLSCASFENDSGSIVLNGYNLTSNGDMSIAGSGGVFSDLSGRKLIANGKMSFTGAAGDSVFIAPSAPACTLNANGPLTASYAVIGNCYSSGSAGHAAVSRNAGNNTNWTFIPAGVKKWVAGGSNNYWSNANNWLPPGVPTASDSVVFDNTSTQECMLDASGTAKSVIFVAGAGMFDFGANTLTVYGNADFSGCSYIMNSGGGRLIFNGSGSSAFTPQNSGIFPSLTCAKSGGMLTLAGNSVNCDTLAVLSGTVNLGNGLAHTVQAINGNSGATLNFGSNTSISVWRDADLSSLNIVAGLGDSIIFNGYFNQTFSMPAQATNLTVDVQKNDTLFLGANSLLIDQLVMNSGVLMLGAGHSHTFNSVVCYGGALDFGNSTVSVTGNVDFSGAQDVVPGSGTLSLTQASGYQYIYEPSSDTLPAIIHSGAASFVVMNPLVCQRFTQNNGQLSLNYQNLTTLGDFTVSNGTASSIIGMDNTTLTVLGNAAMTATGTPLNLNTNIASPWSLSVAGNCSITNAIIGKCSAAGSATWPMLASCVDSGGNTKFDFIPPAAAVTSPPNAAFLNALSSISGTASDAGSGVSKVRIILKRLSDSQYWDGTKWGSAQSMVITAGTTSWSYATAAVSFSDGGYVIQAQAVDNAQNQGALVADSFTIKTTGPSSPAISIVNNNGFTNAGSVQVTCTATGADSMRFLFNATGWTMWEAFGATKTISIVTGGEGMKTISAMYKDRAGNVSAIVSDSIRYDITAPQSPSIMVIDNNGYTNSPTPQLTLSATGVDSMHFQLNTGTWSPFEPYATAKNNFDISAGGNGRKIVGVVFKDKAGNLSTVVQDTTVLDLTAPIASIITPVFRSTINALSVISGTASDALSGVASVQISLKRLVDGMYWNGSSWGTQQSMLHANGTTAWSCALTGISMASSGYVIQAQAIDNALNSGAAALDSFTVKTTIPALPQISIVNNIGSTSSGTVLLALSAAGADSMRLQLNANGWTAWEPYATTKTFSITAGGEGLKKVSVMYEDLAGNASGAVADSIVYDITPPQSSSIAIVDNNGYTGSPTPQISLSAIGADSMHFQLNGAAWSAWEAFAAVKSNFDISTGGNGTKVVAVVFKDKAGNTGTMVHDSTIYDSRLPGVTSVTILDSNGYINTGRPRVQIAVVNADSMRLALAADTAGAPWKPVSVLDSIIVSTGGEGAKKVFVQVKTLANTRSAWVFDSTVYDATPPQSPAIAIAGNSGYTESPTLQISLSAAGADSMQIEVNAQGWTAWLPYATVKNNIDISSGGDGMKRIFARFKDRAYNISATVYDSIIYQRVPVITNVTILDSNGYTNNGRPRVQIAAVNADSMRIALSADSAALWKPFAALDSITISGGGDGLKRVFVQVKTAANVRSAWAFDSTVYDISMPLAVVLTKGSFIAPNWPGMIAGTASDPGSGIKSISFSIQSKNDSTFWNGSAWTKSAVDLQVVRLANWAYAMPCPKLGSYLVLSHAVDSAGNVQSPPDSAIITILKDTLPPAGVTMLHAVLFGTSAVVLTWDKSASNDAESLAVCTSVGTPLTARVLGKWGTMLAASSSVDTLINLPADGSFLYYAVSVKDTLGNWSLFAPNSIRLRDTVPPVNHYGVTLASVGDTAIRVSWTLDPAQGDVASVMFGCAKFALTPLTAAYPYRDSSFVVQNIRDPGLWRVLTYLMDSSGNVSAARFDTITMRPLNTLPVLSSFTLPDTVWVDSLAGGLLAVSDTDAIDSIVISWSAKPAWITVVPRPRAPGGIYSFVIAGRPSAADTGWNRLNCTVSDKSGPAFMVYDSVFVKAKSKAPVVVLRNDQTKLLNAAARFVLGTQNPLDSGVTYEVTLKALDDTTYVKRITSIGGVVDLYPLADGRYELFVTATSAAGLKDTIGLRDTFTIKGATTHQFAGPLDTTVASWQMVSFPTRTMNVGSSSPLSTLFHWDEQAGERDIYGFYHRVSETSQIFPGFGYWRKAADTSTVVIPRSNMLDSVVTITLYKGVYGWNQIASPFPYPVAWNYPGILWQWNDTTHDFTEAGGVLNPWQGYWVMTDTTVTIRLSNKPLFVAPILSKQNVAKFTDKSNWQVSVRLSGGTNTDAENIFGFSADARNGYDASDAAKPPRMSDYQYMFFSHPEWKRGCTEYARDIRRTLNRVEAYTIGIMPGSGKQAPAMSFNGCAKVSPSVMFYLADDKDIVPVEEGKPYAVGKSRTVLYKTLFVTTDKNFLRNFPRVFNLGLPYPNPTRRMANIQYSLPYHIGQAGVSATDPYKVSIALYDVMGRQVRQLVSTMKEPGNYSVSWDGKSNAGLFVATGMYLCKMNAGNFESVKRITVVR
jgi:hypothetical protein